MAISNERLNAFVEEFGPVRVLDPQGKSKTVKSGDPASLELAEKADRIFYRNRWYDRWEFEQIVEANETEY